MKRFLLIGAVLLGIGATSYAVDTKDDFIIPARGNGGQVILEPKDSGGTKRRILTADPANKWLVLPSGVKLGVGTENPGTDDLQVYDATGDAQVKIKGASASSSALLILESGATSSNYNYVNFNSVGTSKAYNVGMYGSDAFVIKDGSTNRMSIDTNGNMCIGSCATTSNKLELRDGIFEIEHSGGTDRFFDFKQFSGWNIRLIGRSTSTYIGIDSVEGTGGTTGRALILNPSGGLVGIGNTDPAGTVSAKSPLVNATGTVNVTSGGTSVSGNGTSFNSEYRNGGQITIYDTPNATWRTVTIATINSATSLTLTANWNWSTQTSNILTSSAPLVLHDAAGTQLFKVGNNGNVTSKGTQNISYGSAGILVWEGVYSNAVSNGGILKARITHGGPGGYGTGRIQIFCSGTNDSALTWGYIGGDRWWRQVNGALPGFTTIGTDYTASSTGSLSIGGAHVSNGVFDVQCNFAVGSAMASATMYVKIIVGGMANDSTYDRGIVAVVFSGT